MAFRPAARHVGEHRQNRQFIIVVPKDKRIMPEQDEAEGNDEKAGARRAKEMVGRLCQTPTLRDVVLAAFHTPYKTTGFPSVITRTFSSIPCSCADLSKR